MGAGSSSLDRVPARSRSSEHVIAVRSVTSGAENNSQNERMDVTEACAKTEVQNKESMKIKRFEELKRNSPVSDAEKMLRIYTREQALVDGYVKAPKRLKRSTDEDVKVHSFRDGNNFRNGDRVTEFENTSKVSKEVLENPIALSSQDDHANTQSSSKSHVKPNEKFMFDNAEILKKRNSDLPVLNPVLDKQSKQTDILHQLGRQGIINKRSDPEKVMNDLRHIGMVKPESEKEEGYTLSMGTPKRTAPRLQPLHVHIDTMQTTYAPWEHDILRQQRHENTQNEDDSGPSGTPKQSKISNNEKLKLKMMDIDLL